MGKRLSENNRLRQNQFTETQAFLRWLALLTLTLDPILLSAESIAFLLL